MRTKLVRASGQIVVVEQCGVTRSASLDLQRSPEVLDVTASLDVSANPRSRIGCGHGDACRVRRIGRQERDLRWIGIEPQIGDVAPPSRSTFPAWSLSARRSRQIPDRGTATSSAIQGSTRRAVRSRNQRDRWDRSRRGRFGTRARRGVKRPPRAVSSSSPQTDWSRATVTSDKREVLGRGWRRVVDLDLKLLRTPFEGPIMSGEHNLLNSSSHRAGRRRNVAVTNVGHGSSAEPAVEHRGLSRSHPTPVSPAGLLAVPASRYSPSRNHCDGGAAVIWSAGRPARTPRPASIRR